MNNVGISQRDALTLPWLQPLRDVLQRFDRRISGSDLFPAVVHVREGLGEALYAVRIVGFARNLLR
jgi:hypothetical protein